MAKIDHEGFDVSARAGSGLALLAVFDGLGPLVPGLKLGWPGADNRCGLALLSMLKGDL